MRIKQYSSNESMIFVWFMMPYTIVINMLVFGSCIVQSLGNFGKTYLVSIIFFAFVYFFFGLVARLIKSRFPEDSKLFKRVAFMLPLFYAMNIIQVQGLYLVYEKINWADCVAVREMEWWVTGFACLASTVLTFINEAAAGWDKWKVSITETEQLKNAYQKTKLLGLKGQVNPHFLFNCFNSLSSLISEDEVAAEKFLNEMTKVHRYMLRGDDEQLVSFQEEVSFARSYLYLIKARFGDAIQTTIECNDADIPGYLPPLSLQVILENIIYTNAASKVSPLKITIKCLEDNRLVITNSIQLKTGSNDIAAVEGLDNLVRKYALLHEEPIQIGESITERKISLPLLAKREVAA